MNVSIRARLTLWYVALVALVLVAFSVGVLWLQNRLSRAELDAELSVLTDALSTSVHRQLAITHELASAARQTREDFNVPNRTTAILDGNGHSVAAHWRGFRVAAIPVAGARNVTTATVLQGDVPWRVRMQREASPEGPFTIFVGASASALIREQHLLVKTLLVGAPLALLLSAGVCWWVASRALAPVTTMSAQAEQITARSLDTRLSGTDVHDEVGQLRRAFNRLLDRVAASVATQRQFMADASHELRTPVSAARTAAEVTLSQPRRDEDEYRDALGVVFAQTRRMGRMVDDMLILARADAGGYRLRRAASCLDELLEECADAARVLAAAKGVAFDMCIQTDVHAEVDDTLIRQLALNLLENAVKHTPAGGRVSLTLSADANRAVIAVTDTGAGIPPSDRERIFERFVRLDSARDNASGGAGLGLPIARWVAEMHHGTLTLEGSGPSGSTFVARLPVAAATTAAVRRAWTTYPRRVSASNPTVSSDAT